MAKPSQYPAFDHLHSDFHLGFVLRLSGPGGKNHRVIVIGKFSGRPIECRFVAIRHSNKGTGIVRNDQGGNTADERQGAANTHVTQRLRRWLCTKHKVPGKGITRYPNQYLYEQLGLINLPARTHDLPWAKA